MFDWTFLYFIFKEKENRRPEAPLNVQHISQNSGSSGSLPKRYQSVFTEGTPLISFGVRNDENYQRAHSVRKFIIFLNIQYSFYYL